MLTYIGTYERTYIYIFEVQLYFIINSSVLYLSSLLLCQVFIHGFADHEHEQTISFSRPVKAVAINPDFTKGAKQVVAGDDKVSS